jgi:hypothetical protein
MLAFTVLAIPSRSKRSSLLRLSMFHGRIPLAHQDLRASTSEFESQRFGSSTKRATT